jgi:phenylacetyl-CoA:acceptor oxidoreductase subunit 1
MVIDLGRCVGCQTCTIACKQEHDLPPGTFWRFVADCEVGEYPDVRRVFLPMQCMHCAAPPCVPVCPTGASRQRADGIVWIDYDACVGCGYCAMACPYHARHLVEEPRPWFAPETAPERPGARPERRGVMTKCTFCRERVDTGRAAGLTPGVDADATPTCAVACIAGAIVFGDLDDPSSPAARWLAAGGARPLMPECGTEPRVYYLPAERDRRPDTTDPPDAEPYVTADEARRDRLEAERMAQRGCLHVGA